MRQAKSLNIMKLRILVPYFDCKNMYIKNLIKRSRPARP